jgi:hypothetical protein
VVLADQGFEVPETILRLDFVDRSFDGLVVRMFPASTGAVERIGSLAFIDPKAGITKDVYDTMVFARKAFADALVEWNLRRRGVAVPATVEGVGSLDDAFLMQLVGAWMEGTKRALQAAVTAQELDASTLPMELN